MSQWHHQCSEMSENNENGGWASIIIAIKS
jgi:hypothetical protein